MQDQKYSTLYNVNLSLTYNKKNVINIPTSDIVSIAIINNYDSMTFPMIRIRLYSDISIMQQISEFTDDIIVRGNIDGCIYRMPEDRESSPQRIKPTPSMSFKGLKAYIRQKNIATSSFDQFIQGVRRETDLNNQTKVPIELLCYDEHVVSNMILQTPSIYKNVSLEYVLRFIFDRVNIPIKQFDVVENHTKYPQLIIPNLEVIDSISFLDNFYGLYKKGGQLYNDLDGSYIVNTDAINTKPLPIHIRSATSNDDMSGLRKFGDQYMMGTMSKNVSIMSESDLQKVVQPNKLTAVDIKDFKIQSTNMTDMFKDTKQTDWKQYTITHASQNPFLTEMYNARVKEKSTIISVSGNGFEISIFKVNSRFNLIWESPIRGHNINDVYRPVFINHVFTNLDSKLFIVESTMNLVTN